MAEKTGVIYGINGPVIYMKDAVGFKMAEMVYVGKERLVGEVISITGNMTSVQVYEETGGLIPGETVIGTGAPLAITLGPGILHGSFDGIERPLDEIAKLSGKFIARGVSVNSLDTEKKWDVKIKVKAGDPISGGMVIAETQETPSILHRSMVPPDIHEAVVLEAVPDGSYTVAVPDGSYTVTDTIVRAELPDGSVRELMLAQRWPIRIPRPCAKRLPASEPLVTGQRILDTLFPIARGGTAAIPGGFGTGKTMTQHSIAKFSNANVIIYIGCGERGNEMTEVLEDFSKLEDPQTGNKLMARTALIANTSNMPVAAREASIYTGITLAEYYRDMGYDVAIMADSTSRWSRLAAFYERAGQMKTLCGEVGSVSIIGAVSPQGGDFSEPVTMNTKRFVRCFWGLDKSLAYARHYPAINWVESYSEYVRDLSPWYRANVDRRFVEDRSKITAILSTEDKLMETVRLIGSDVLPDDQKLTLEIARVIRQGFLQQNAFHEEDRNVPLKKQFLMMETILYLYARAKELIAAGHPMSVLKREAVFEKIIAIKYDVPNAKPELFEDYRKMIDDFCARVVEKNG